MLVAMPTHILDEIRCRISSFKEAHPDIALDEQQATTDMLHVLSLTGKLPEIAKEE